MSAADGAAPRREQPPAADTPNVVAIVGSPRRHGNTAYATGLAVAELERRGIRCQTIWLAKLRLDPCLAHDDCGTRERCPRRDDAEAVFDSVWAATGLILASPVFFATVSAQMKTFMDRTNHRYLHGPVLHPKAVGLIAVGGQGGSRTRCAPSNATSRSCALRCRPWRRRAASPTSWATRRSRTSCASRSWRWPGAWPTPCCRRSRDRRSQQLPPCRRVPAAVSCRSPARAGRANAARCCAVVALRPSLPARRRGEHEEQKDAAGEADDGRWSMRRGIRIARVFGIDISIHPSWFIILLLIVWSLGAGAFPAIYDDWSTARYWLVAVISALLLFASVLVHELAHSLVALRQGTPVKGITLFFLGGVASIEREATTPGREALMAGAGPLTSIVLGGAFLGLGWAVSAPEVLQAILLYLGLINLVVAAFNLLPGFPLDGGRLLRAAIWAIRGDFVAATRDATRVSTVIAVGLMVYGGYLALTGNPIGGLWLVFIGWIVIQASQASYSQTLSHWRSAADLPDSPPNGTSMQAKGMLTRKHGVYLCRTSVSGGQEASAAGASSLIRGGSAS